jgi:mannosyl-oligosaccharide glucosidase
LSSREVLASETESIKVALSSLLGGIGYFEGIPMIEFAITSELDLTGFDQLQTAVNKSSVARTRLFTGTPSRTAFPRGFLWDEGFHQMVMSHWDIDITFHVIADWLNAMYTSPLPDGINKEDLMGWIPREMILGNDASRRVPNEFIMQRTTIANPPTFLLVIESLMNRLTLSESCSDSEKVCSNLNRRIIDFVDNIYPRLHYWIQWFRFTQQGNEPFSFRWRGRSAHDNKVVPNTLASGLDDYPRGILPDKAELHVDLHCWMIKAYEVMQTIEDVLSTTASVSPRTQHIINRSSYKATAMKLRDSLDSFHWSEEWKGYFDYGLMDEGSEFVPMVMFRCATENQSPQTTVDLFISVQVLQSRSPFCPESHPKPLYPMGDGHGGYIMRETVVTKNLTMNLIPRIGYVSIFPLLLKSISPLSPKLSVLLDMIEDPNLLYTPYGLRSIAKSDTYYMRRNAPGDAPYWRYRTSLFCCTFICFHFITR